MRGNSPFPMLVVDAARTSVLDMVAASVRTTIAEAIYPLLIWPFLLIWRGFWVLVWVFGFWFLCGVMDSMLIQYDDGGGAAIVRGLKFVAKGPSWIYGDFRDRDKVAAEGRRQREKAANKPEAVEARRRTAALREVDAFVDEVNRRRSAGEFRDVPADEFNRALGLARVEALKELRLLPPEKRKKSPTLPGETIYDFRRRIGMPPELNSPPLPPTATSR